MRERADHIAKVMVQEQGKVYAEARGETLVSADIIDWYAEEGRRTYGRVIPGRQKGVRQMVLQEPVGVVAAFTPWNFPILTPVRKIAGSLAAGCSIIIKAAEETFKQQDIMFGSLLLTGNEQLMMETLSNLMAELKYGGKTKAELATELGMLNDELTTCWQEAVALLEKNRRFAS